MKSTAYIKPLDGLRCLAVTLVLFDHWSGDALGFPASYLGVCMFFVLSGFLITRILLAAREKDTQENRGHSFSLKRFYIRRTLRIFPLYYLTLAILWFIDFRAVRDTFGWVATYMSNNWIAFNTQWLGKVDHLWSLAVEEQYYLFFPFLLFFIPFKKIQNLLIWMILFSVGMRAGLFASGASWITPYVLMPTCLDAFGFGGLLAYGFYYQKERLVSFFSSLKTLLFSIGVYILVVLLMHSLSEGHNIISIVFLRLAESFLSVCLVGVLIANEDSFGQKIKNFFSWHPFVYIGKVSYGIYIFHNLIYNPYHESGDSYVSSLLQKLSIHFPSFFDHVPGKIVVLYVLTVALATVSWYLFEKPINQLKNKYGY